MIKLTEQEIAKLRLKAKHGVLEPHEDALWSEYQNMQAYDKGIESREQRMEELTKAVDARPKRKLVQWEVIIITIVIMFVIIIGSILLIFGYGKIADVGSGGDRMTTVTNNDEVSIETEIVNTVDFNQRIVDFHSAYSKLEPVESLYGTDKEVAYFDIGTCTFNIIARDTSSTVTIFLTGEEKTDAYRPYLYNVIKILQPDLSKKDIDAAFDLAVEKNERISLGNGVLEYNSNSRELRIEF